MFPDFQFSNESLDSSGEGGGRGLPVMDFFVFFFLIVILFRCLFVFLVICFFFVVVVILWLYYYRCRRGLCVSSRSWVSDRFLFIFGIQIFVRESLRCRPRDGVISDVS